MTYFRIPGLANNPTTREDPWQFLATGPRTAQLRNFDDLNYIMTYHLPNADIKYTGGVQGYDYTLNFDDDTNVTSFVLPGSAGGIQAGEVDAVAPLIAAAEHLPPAAIPAVEAGILAGLPAPSVLPINPLVHVNFIENDWWTSHELSIQSTDQSPLQYIAGVWYYYQQYAQPTNVTTTQPNYANPVQVVPFLTAEAANPLAFLFPGALAPAAANPKGLLELSAYQFQYQSIAGYGQVSYKVTDDIKITGNLRVSNDHKWGEEEERLI